MGGHEEFWMGKRYKIYENILTHWKSHYFSLETPGFYSPWNNVRGEREPEEWTTPRHFQVTSGTRWWGGELSRKWWKGEEGPGGKGTEKGQSSVFGNGSCTWVKMTDVNVALVQAPAPPLMIWVTLDESTLMQENVLWAIDNPLGFTYFPYSTKFPFSHISWPTHDTFTHLTCFPFTSVGLMENSWNVKLAWLKWEH